MAPTADSKAIRLNLNAKQTDVRKLATVYTQSQFFTSGTTATLKITNTTEGTSGSGNAKGTGGGRPGGRV